MTWLYVPSLSAQASGASTSASGSLDPTRAVSLTLRGKQAQPQALSRAWKRGGFIRLLFGLTCEPSTLERGAAQWIASCRAIPAREIVSPESGLAPTTIAGCSTASSRSSIKAGLLCSSARTSRGISPDSSPLPFQHWSDWGAALRAEYSARPRPERRTDASDSSCWLTVRASDTNGAGSHGDGGIDLRTAAAQWETPSVAVTAGTRLTRGGERNSELLLTGQAVATSEHWSTPRASDGEKGGPNMAFGAGGTPLPAQAAHWPTPAAQNWKGSSEGSITRQDGKSRMDILCYAAEQGFPHSPPDPQTTDGLASSPQRRRLNPLFVEWLMGWPEGLSGFDTAGMASCHSLRPSPGCGCMDCWLTTQRAMLSDLLTIEPPAQPSLL